MNKQLEHQLGIQLDDWVDVQLDDVLGWHLWGELRGLRAQPKRQLGDQLNTQLNISLQTHLECLTN